ncbi:unnamed protein product [Lupinus luteus]|uniref:Protein disulfide-isomerase n=1 Tax=Lupinus luteus TaxID=3873 RepID=A0AAV1XJG7_LUPLU
MRTFLLLSLTTLLLFSSLSLISSTVTDADADDEDLTFLQDSDDTTSDHHHHYDYPDPENFQDYGADLGDFDHDEYKSPEIDDKDVVVLKNNNFSDFVKSNRFVLVEFYAPWCGHCQELAPHYAEAATVLKGENVILAKVDATEESELGTVYEIEGFPTIYFFVDGVHKPYKGLRTKDAIVNWIKKKTGPGIYNITSLDDAERILTSESKIVLAFINSLVGPESDELAAASRLEDDVNFYQTVNPDVAKLFHIDPNVKRPALVLIKKEDEKLNHFDGQFAKSEIEKFVTTNKLPLVTVFTMEGAPEIFENPTKNQVFIYLLLFATSNDSEKLIPVFREAAKNFKGKLIFVYVESDNEEVGKPVSEYFGIGGDAPKVLAYTGNEDGQKFVLNGEVTFDNIKVFGENFLEGKLKPYLKSDPVPESNDGDVKIVVGSNFDEIVLDESKDVLLEIYAPWCGHCQALEPIYNKLAKHLRGIESIVIAKMDGTTNEHPRAKADGFPTLLFFPAGDKSFSPITVETDRTAVALYKFLKKNASIPFKLQKPTSTSKPPSSDAKESGDSKERQSSSEDVKDEL